MGHVSTVVTSPGSGEFPGLHPLHTCTVGLRSLPHRNAVRPDDTRSRTHAEQLLAHAGFATIRSCPALGSVLEVSGHVSGT